MKAKILAIWICCYLTGLLFAPLFVLPPDQPVFLMVLLFLLSFLFWPKRYLWAALLGVSVFFLAVYLFQAKTLRYEEINNSISNYSGQMTAIVNDIPQNTEHGQTVELKFTKIKNFPGVKVLAYAKAYPELRFGETIQFLGSIERFQAEKEARLIAKDRAGEIYISRLTVTGESQEFYYRAKKMLLYLRIKMNEVLRLSLPKEEAGLASGLILGEKALISPEIKRWLQASGTTHIIALSGYNITILLTLFAFLKNRYSRLTNFLVPLAFISLFVIMTGASASIVRAAIMGFMPILAMLLGRPKNSLMAVLFSAFVMALFNPYILLFDAGFQLSFLAMIGLLFNSPVIQNCFSLQNNLTAIFAETLGAQLAVLPLLAFYFGQISVISPISNLVILSLVPVSMLVAFLVGFSGMFSLSLAKFIAIPAYVLLKLFNLLISFFGSLSFSAIQFSFENPVWIFVYFFAVFDILFILKKKTDNQV